MSRQSPHGAGTTQKEQPWKKIEQYKAVTGDELPVTIRQETQQCSSQTEKDGAMQPKPSPVMYNE